LLPPRWGTATLFVIVMGHAPWKVNRLLVTLLNSYLSERPQNIDSESLKSHLTRGGSSLTALTIFWRSSKEVVPKTPLPTFLVKAFYSTFTVTYTLLSKNTSGDEAVNLYLGNTWIETWLSWFSLFLPPDVIILNMATSFGTCSQLACFHFTPDVIILNMATSFRTYSQLACFHFT
jgi:hypothetical protein